MTIPKLSYIDFIQQPESVRIELQEYILVAVMFESDCMNWKWGKVKECQELLANEMTYKDIFEIAKFESESITEQTDFHVVLGLFNAVSKSMAQLLQVEGEALNHVSSPKELQASEAVGGFEAFGTLPQTLSLIPLFGCGIKDIRDMQWSECFTALVYEKRRNDFNKQLLTND